MSVEDGKRMFREAHPSREQRDPRREPEVPPKVPEGAGQHSYTGDLEQEQRPSGGVEAGRAMFERLHPRRDEANDCS